MTVNTPVTRRRALSLRARVLVGLAAIGLVAIVAATAVTVTTRNYLLTQLDERLLAFTGPPHADGGRDVNDYLEDSDDDDVPSGGAVDWWTDRPSEALRGKLYVDGTYTQVWSPNIYSDDEPDEITIPLFASAPLPAEGDAYFTVPSTGDEHYRILARPIRGGWEITGLSLEGVESTRQRLVMIEALGIGALLMGLGLVAWWVIRLGINPMRRMVDASTRIANGDLDVRLEGASSGTESAALATSLNTMIGRLTDALSERERSEARVREFVADASHELRTPLTTVLGYAQLYRKGALSREDEQADAWGRTEAEAARMKRLVEDMLELARYDAEPEVHVERIDMTSVVAEVLADAARAHPEVAFTVGGARPVAPDVPGAVMAEVDGDRLRQAIINVISNAAQHGAHHVVVTVSEEPRGDDADVRIEVADDGPGMSPEVAARAPERFVRGESSRSRSTGGAGLGLAITAAIVEAHHGRLDIVSVEGEGTRVGIVVPQVQPPA